MIQKIPAFQTDDGFTHASVEEAQKHQLQIELSKCTGLSEPNSAAAFIMANVDRFIDILTTTATSKPKARKINGGTKVRKPKPTTAPATAPV